MAMMALTAFAQKSNSSFLEFQTDFATTKGVKPSIGLKGGFLAGIDTNVRLGAGIGLTENTQFKYAPSMPVFGRLEFLFSGTNVRPFIDVDLGYSVNFEDFENGQVFINPMIGADFNKYYIGVGYLGSTSFAENSTWGSNIALRLGMRFDGSSNPFAKFFKRTTFGVEGSYAHGFGKSKRNYGGGYDNSLNVLLASVHMMYNIDEHWAAGVGASYGYTSYKEHYDKKNLESSTVSHDGYIEIFGRGEYTFDEVKQDIKPYINADFGVTEWGTFVSPGAGIKYKDHIRAGIALPYREHAYHGDDSGNVLGLEFHIGYDF